MKPTKCECEHVDHFNNGPGHPYGKAKAMAIRMTKYGRFAQCAPCQKAGHQS